MMKHVQLPPYISTGDPGSFAMKTILVRLPEIVDQVIQLNQFSEVPDRWSPERQLIALKDDIPNGPIRDPFESFSRVESLFQAEEIRIWREEIAKYAGKPWIGIPWYFAEAYFYLKLLLAFGYYTKDSPLYLNDPFQPHKEKELLLQGGGLEIGREITHYLEKLGDEQDIVDALIFFSLWGNRIDLSNLQIVEQSRGLIISRDKTHLLLDHSQALRQKLMDAGRIDIILDNSGSELVCDLLTACYLLDADAQLTLYLHTKQAPILVSDALQKDVQGTINAFLEDQDAGLVKAGRQLRSFVENQRLVIKEHYFWNGPLHFPDFPREIQNDLLQSDLVLLKGDANYRRLLSDRKWPTSAHMEDITGYFPSSFAMLRTMKGEIVVDLDEKTVANLFHADPQWMLNGKRGIIRFVQI
jgi:uncharacterized protein with ATP-grasp and redox domains